MGKCDSKAKQMTQHHSQSGIAKAAEFNPSLSFRTPYHHIIPSVCMCLQKMFLLCVLASAPLQPATSEEKLLYLKQRQLCYPERWLPNLLLSWPTPKREDLV